MASDRPTIDDVYFSESFPNPLGEVKRPGQRSLIRAALSGHAELRSLLERKVSTSEPVSLEGWSVDVRSRRRSPPEDAIRGMTAELLPVIREMARDIAALKEKVEALSEQISDLKAEIADRPVIKTMVLHDFSSEVYALRQPLAIVVEQYASETVASFPNIEAFGAGSSEPEAIALLEQEIIDLYEQLQLIDQRELGPIPRGWLRVLNKLLEKRGEA